MKWLALVTKDQIDDWGSSLENEIFNYNKFKDSANIQRPNSYSVKITNLYFFV